ncbi:MAG: alpha/beta hydrolase-fold protein [Bryobacterales bacterium]
MLTPLTRILAVATLFAAALAAQTEFQWNNPLPANAPEGVEHATFYSKANKTTVGYNILLPPGYNAPENAQRRYPVIYYLHGGRPGGEQKSVGLAQVMGDAMRAGDVPPMIYVFVNGGKLSHYDHEGSLGETAFVQELIPHVDKTYRTIAERNGRGVEGFSQGGRGTARYLFKHRDLFVSAAPMGGGHQYERLIDQNDGAESDSLRISPPWNNTWELARRYAADRDGLPVNILVVVGTKDQNYQPNLDWMAHLTDLGIPFERIIVPDTPHSAKEVYAKRGLDCMRFHAANFERALGKSW